LVIPNEQRATPRGDFYGATPSGKFNKSGLGPFFRPAATFQIVLTGPGQNMFSSTHLGEIMETTCNQCKSRFRITEKQLKQAYGKVCCGECGSVFNAMIGLKNYDGELPPDYLLQQYDEDEPFIDDTVTELVYADEPSMHPNESEPENAPELSLHEAMYGSKRRSFLTMSPLTWLIGILLLSAIGVAQAIYYQRYELIENPRYQQQVINICQLLPCAPSQFSSTEQIRLLERNVFTHPVSSNALMMTGSFVNKAPFAQKLPDMLISLFDVKGKLIANRLFAAPEYLLTDKNRSVMQPEKPVQFRLEVIDPGVDALTYEFEFF
jgi:predicted Zn finger-like uncharacterized protein